MQLTLYLYKPVSVTVFSELTHISFTVKPRLSGMFRTGSIPDYRFFRLIGAEFRIGFSMNFYLIDF